MVKIELRLKLDVKKLSETTKYYKTQYFIKSKTVVTLQLVKASYDSYS